MNDIMNLVMQEIGGGNIGQISEAIGADEDSTQRGIAAAVPMLLGAVNQQSQQQPDEMAGMMNMVGGLMGGGTQSGGGNPLMGMLGGLLGGGQQQNAGGMDMGTGMNMLQGLLGGQQGMAEQRVSEASGLHPDAVARLLPILAPIVMGAIGNMFQQQSGNAPQQDPQGVAQFVGNQTAQAQQQSPGLMGFLNNFDSDHDGNPMEEIGALANQFFGRR